VERKKAYYKRNLGFVKDINAERFSYIPCVIVGESSPSGMIKVEFERSGRRIRRTVKTTNVVTSTDAL